MDSRADFRSVAWIYSPKQCGFARGCRLAVKIARRDHRQCEAGSLPSRARGSQDLPWQMGATGWEVRKDIYRPADFTRLENRRCCEAQFRVFPVPEILRRLKRRGSTGSRG